jgi:hypothetical protein
VPGIDGRGHRRTEVHVAQAEHQVARAIDDLLHVVFAAEAVDAPDELYVARRPGGICTHRLHVLLYGKLGCRIIPRQGQVDDTGRHFRGGTAAQRRLALRQDVQKSSQRQLQALVVDL